MQGSADAGDDDQSRPMTKPTIAKHTKARRQRMNTPSLNATEAYLNSIGPRPNAVNVSR
jgi:hypothetical protein